MSIDKLRKQVEKAQAEANRLQGRLSTVTEHLATTYGCTTAKQTKAKLAELQAAADKAKAAYETAHQKFEEDHAETLGRVARAK